MKLPDLAKSFKLLKISTELEVCRGDSIFAHSIREGLRKPKNLIPVIKMIQDQAKSNRGLVEHIVGVELLKEIETI
jgi:hypothetical protein